MSANTLPPRSPTPRPAPGAQVWLSHELFWGTQWLKGGNPLHYFFWLPAAYFIYSPHHPNLRSEILTQQSCTVVQQGGGGWKVGLILNVSVLIGYEILLLLGRGLADVTQS